MTAGVKKVFDKICNNEISNDSFYLTRGRALFLYLKKRVSSKILPYKKILLLLLFLFSFMDAIELTEEEKKYLSTKPYISVMNMDKFQPYTFLKDDKPTGYTIDVMKLMGKRINKEIKFITNPWNKQLQDLQDGKIDIIPYIVNTKERQKYIEFTDFSHIRFTIGFAIDKRFKINSMEELEGKTVAVVKKSFMYDHLKKNFPKIKVYGTNSVEESLTAVVLKKAFTTLDNTNTLKYLIAQKSLNSLKIITVDDLGLPHSNKLHMGVKKGNTILKTILEKVHQSLPFDDVEKLQKKWFDKKVSILSLTEEEKRYLARKPYLTTMSLSRFHPFAFIKDGNHMGYSNDLLRIFSEILNKELKYITKPWKEQLEMLKDGSLDFVPYLAWNEERSTYMDFTDFEYFSYLNGLTVHKDSKFNTAEELKGKTIAVVNKYWYHDHLKKYFPEIKLLLTNSTEESVQAVAHNKADAAMDNITSMNYYIQELWLHNLKISSLKDLKLPVKSRLYMSVKKGNYLLKSILEKTYNSIPEETILKLKEQWFKGVKASRIGINLTMEEEKYLRDKKKLTVTNLGTFPPFNFYDNNQPLGYTVDYIKLMAQYMNIDIEFISDKPFKEYLSMLKNGTLDIIPHLAVTNERKKFVEYTNFNHIEYTTGFAIKKGEKISSMKELENKIIAVTNKSFVHTKLKKLYPNQKLFLTSSSSDALEAVSLGKADAVIGSLPALHYFIQKDWISNVEVVKINDSGFLQKTQLPMGVQKGNLILKSILEKTNNAISHNEIFNLKQKWMNMKPAENTTFTKEENKYLESKQEIKMCVLPNWLPFEQIDIDGNHKGIGDDIIQIISQYIDKPINLVPTKEWSQSLQNISERKCDILPVAMDVPSRRATMTFTKPYVNEPFVIATTIDKQFIKDSHAIGNKKIGIVKSYAFIEVLRQRNPNVKIVEVNNTKEGLEKVRDGELFGYIDTMPTISYFIQKFSMLDLKIAGKLEFNIELSIASRNDEPLLNSILQKALDSISDDQIRTIVGKWVHIKVEQNFDYRKLFYIAGFFIVLLLLVLYRNRTIERMNNKLFEQQQMVDKYVLILETDLKGVITRVNDAYCQSLGFAKKELIGQTHTIVRHPDTTSELIKNLWETINCNKTWIGMVANYTKKKETKYFNIYIEALFKGRVKIGYRSISEDITDKHTVESLANYQKSLLSLFDKGDAVIFKLKHNNLGTVEYASQSVVSLTGYTQEDMLSQNINYFDLIEKEDFPERYKELNKTISQGLDSLKHEPYRIITKDGSLKWVLDYTVILRDTNNNITNLLSYVTDITEHIMHQAISSQQAKMASLGEMIGNIAHQWRQPLSVISSIATGSMISKELGSLTDEDFKNNMNAINSNSQYLSDTIDDFKNYIKGERSLKKFLLSENIHRFLTVVNTSVEKHHIQIIEDSQSNIEIESYSNEMIQIFVNIFNNAKDVLINLPENERYFFITTLMSNEKITILLKDNAGGIDESIITKIFEPYITTKHKSQGTGLGLNIAYNLVVNGLQGTISAKNCEYTYLNKKYIGAEFKIILPQSLTKNL